MKATGFACNYYNSGSFGFPKGLPIHVAAWIGPDDPTIRAEVQQYVRQVTPPFESTLARLTKRIWRELIGDSIWVMPASHWAFELDFGSRDWMPRLLERHGIDPAQLHDRTDGSAIEFCADEQFQFAEFLETLLARLTASDFTLAFPGQSIVCSVHHHQQLWWVTSDSALHSKLRELPNG